MPETRLESAPNQADAAPPVKKSGWLWAIGLLLVCCAGYSLAGPILNWPSMDEGNYILEAARIANGQLPYRDFYDFITPGGQLLGAIYIALGGLSVVGLRLLVVLGILLSMALVYDMTRPRLSKPWQILLLAFLWLSASRYPVFQHHFWSGLTALTAVYFVWRYLKQFYQNELWEPQAAHPQPKPTYLILSGLFTGLTFWITQSLGGFIALSLGGYSLLHCILHEREEKGVSFSKVSRIAVVRRWLRTWGIMWLVPVLLVHGVWVGSFMLLGIWDDFWRDSVLWLTRGHYQQTTVIGYFSTFHQEFMDTIRPFLDGVPMPALLLFVFRLPIVLHLLLIGMLPIIGILCAWYKLPGRFLYRLLRQEDEERLLFLTTAMGFVLSTFNYSGSMHITSNGVIPFLLGWWVLYDYFRARPRFDKAMQRLTGVFFGLLLIGAMIGSWLQLAGAVTLPRFRGMSEALLHTDPSTSAQDFLDVVNVLEEAKRKGRTVFVFCETPALYLPGLYQNATRFTLILPFYTSPPQMKEIFADLQRNKPLYIVDDATRFRLHKDGRFRQYQPEQLRMPEMEAYLKQYYTLKTTAGLYTIYQRNTYFE